MAKRFLNMDRSLLIYFVIIGLTALALGFSNDVMNPYFNDAYEVTAYQRGIIEFPRELPGVLVIFVVAILSAFSDIKLSIVAQLLSIIGIGVLGLMTPAYSMMLVFIFINSLGMHMFFPLQDSIGMSLVEGDNLGKRMGQFKGVSTAFTMIAGIFVFIGFRLGFLTFKTNHNILFLISAVISLLVLILLIILERINKQPIKSYKKINFVFRKEYKYYYTLVVMFGVQKQIMIVYGPWVLLNLLNKKADTLAILTILGALIGTFFIPAIGRWIDHFGIKTFLYVDALSFIGVYLFYGLLSAGFASGKLAIVGLPVLLAYGLYILDRMSNQFGMIRTIYLKSIAVDPKDITPTLSLGQSLDHVVSITCAILGGIVWSFWGPQYIFFLAATLSLVNLYVAIKVKIPAKNPITD